MGKSLISVAVATVFLAGCAATSSMSPEQLAECLQPNRRVVVEIGGMAPKPKPKPKPKPAADKPEAKPAAKAEAKPEAKPAAKKPAKPALMPVELSALAQGNFSWDIGKAALKTGAGTEDIDQLLASIKKRNVTVHSVIISGHADRLEVAAGGKTLSEDRAKAVKDYLVSRGIDEKLIFWEGKDAREPVPVTKFCE